jgi:hypothetical protein
VARRLILLLTLLAALTGAASAEAKPLTKYQVGGGLAGRYSELTLQTDGRALQTGDNGEHHFKVSAKRLRGLKSALKAAKFKTLKRSYAPDGQVFDGTTQVIHYRGKSVSVSSGAELPARLAKVINRLSRILRYR